MKQIYLFSGLGADYRAFEKLDFSGYEIHHIQWVQPDNVSSIEGYAKQMVSQIQTQKPILIGLSFGGMVAAEVAKLIQAEKVILLASAKTKFEIPFYYRWAGYFGLHKLLPLKWFIKWDFINFWAFGATTQSDQAVLKAIVNDTDLLFLKWALHAIVKWQNTERNESIYHLHGTTDRILPFCFVNADFKVKGGGHLMTINKSEEISEKIKKILSLDCGK